MASSLPVGFQAAASGPVTLSSRGRGWAEIDCELRHVASGIHRIPGAVWHRLGVHFGPPVNADCRADGIRHRRVQSQGDADFVPAGLDGMWSDDRDCTILSISLSPTLLTRVADDCGLRGENVVRSPRFQIRDERIEYIASALKAELEAPVPTGRLYAESLGAALAARLVADASDWSPTVSRGLTPRQQRILVEFVEANLEHDLGLDDLAAIAGLSLSQLKLLFRRTMGQPVHAYVISRRVERARALLGSGATISQAALAAGFAHQSHMAHWMKRLLGVTPRDFLRSR